MDDQPLHLLLVEDNDTHALIVEKAFRACSKAGTMDRVTDGRKAIAYLKQQDGYRDRRRPRVILLDLKLPHVDGLNVLRTLKADDQLKSIPVVVLTTSDAPNDVSDAYRLHANSYLVKPASFATFRDLIAAVMSYWGSWNQPPLPAECPNPPSDC